MTTTMTNVLLTPDPSELAPAAHGLLMDELVNSSLCGNLPGADFSLSYLHLPPDKVTAFHNHHKAIIVVILLAAGAEGAATDVVFPTDGESVDEAVDKAVSEKRAAKRYVHHPGQVLVVEPGLPHRATNLSATEEVTGFELRVGSESVFVDNNLLPVLNGVGVELVVDPIAAWRVGQRLLGNRLVS